MTTVRVLPVTKECLPDVETLVFEYLALTQGECGRPVPDSPDLLPEALRAECSDLLAAYRPPGALFAVYDSGGPIGCVGLRTDPSTPDTITVKRLYVRAAHRRAGAAHLLMRRAHQHAIDHGFTRVTLDVMRSRTHVIDFYRRLGYTDAAQFPDWLPDDMIVLHRAVNEPATPPSTPDRAGRPVDRHVSNP